MHDSPYTEVPLSGPKGAGLVALVDTADLELVSDKRWFLHSCGYAHTSNGLYMHRHILGLRKGDRVRVDHHNGNVLDNRRANLRIGDASLNGQNRVRLDRDNTSGYRGVWWHKGTCKWAAEGWLRGTKHTIGYFTDVHEAGRAASEWRAENMPFAQDAD